MNKVDRLRILRLLEERGVVKEEAPNTQYWRFLVLDPAKLPKAFHKEYKKHGEIYVRD